MINIVVITLCCIQEKWFIKKSHIILIFIYYTIIFLLKIINHWSIYFIIILSYFIIPIILTRNKKRYIFIMFILDNIFQILSNFTRGNSLIICDTYIINKIMLIDYYLMFLIYYIGGCYMGLVTLLPWFTKKETVIDAKIEKLEKKIKKLEEQKQCLKKQ